MDFVRFRTLDRLFVIYNLGNWLANEWWGGGLMIGVSKTPLLKDPVCAYLL